MQLEEEEFLKKVGQRDSNVRGVSVSELSCPLILERFLESDRYALKIDPEKTGGAVHITVAIDGYSSLKRKCVVVSIKVLNVGEVCMRPYNSPIVGCAECTEETDMLAACFAATWSEFSQLQENGLSIKGNIYPVQLWLTADLHMQRVSFSLPILCDSFTIKGVDGDRAECHEVLLPVVLRFVRQPRSSGRTENNNRFVCEILSWRA